MKIQKSKGFTIIELLVIIAIVVILTAIVLVNVMGYITKSRYSAIKAGLSNIQTLGTIYFSTNGDYAGFCSNSDTITIRDNIYNSGGFPNCNSTNTAWCFCSTTSLQFSPPWQTICVDSTGYKKETSNVFCMLRCSDGNGSAPFYCVD
jgi:type II secretory pathway pseudopilin PulG